MKIRYFEDTETALIEFSSKEIAEISEISDNVFADLDEEGNLVSMTIEHAADTANILDFTFERAKKISA